MKCIFIVFAGLLMLCRCSPNQVSHSVGLQVVGTYNVDQSIMTAGLLNELTHLTQNMWMTRRCHMIIGLADPGCQPRRGVIARKSISSLRDWQSANKTPNLKLID